MKKLLASSATCAFCHRAPERTCPQCRRRFCPRHGSERCIACAEPARFLPSPLRFQLVTALLPAAILLSIWFLVSARPPAGPEPVVADQGATQVDEGLSSSPTPAPVTAPTPTPTPSPTPPPTPTPAPTPPPPATYTVQSGDTIWGIAARCGTTPEQLQELNNLPNPDALQIGQVLRVPAPCSP